MINLKSNAATVTIDPHGARIGRYSLADGRDIFAPPPGQTGDFATACLPMIPWCNRIAHGVTLDDGHHPIAPNVEGQGCPIHGSAFQREWHVEQQTQETVHLTLDCDAPAPFRYRARIEFALHGADLHIDLTLTNRADRPLPMGFGLHPWMPRTPGTRLRAKAARYQTVDAALLPTGTAPVADRPEWTFDGEQGLPQTLIDTAFTGWNGSATLDWPDRDLSLDIETRPALNWFQVYSPGPDSGFVCFEPCTHGIDAHNAPGHPDLWTLAPDEGRGVHFTFAPVLGAA